MPLIDMQPDVVAQTYARSLFELATEHGGQARLETVLGQLEDVLELARIDRQFNEFLASLALPADKRRASMQRVFGPRLDKLALDFMLVLNDKGRLQFLPTIVRALDTMVQESFGRIEVDVHTPAPIQASELDRLKGRLRAALGKDVIVHPYTDDSMIAGMRLRIGDHLIDSSVATRLRRIGDQLRDNGLSALRSRIDRATEGDPMS